MSVEGRDSDGSTEARDFAQHAYFRDIGWGVVIGRLLFMLWVALLETGCVHLTVDEDGQHFRVANCIAKAHEGSHRVIFTCYHKVHFLGS